MSAAANTDGSGFKSQGAHYLNESPACVETEARWPTRWPPLCRYVRAGRPTVLHASGLEPLSIPPDCQESRSFWPGLELPVQASSVHPSAPCGSFFVE